MRAGWKVFSLQSFSRAKQILGQKGKIIRDFRNEADAVI